MNDLMTKDDVRVFVDAFYAAVKTDELIGPVFGDRLNASNWSKHMEQMYSFWNTLLFGVADYRGMPFPHHIKLGLEAQHFDRWLQLFESSIHEHFEGSKVDEALDRAHKMRLMFEAKLTHINNHPNRNTIL